MRMRMEKIASTARLCDLLHCRLVGSPPVVRGLLWMTLPRGGVIWFIPGRAGSAHGSSLGRHPISVHPRSCGVFYLPMALFIFLIGSPPEVRGLPSRFLEQSSFSWFTPGRAGSAFQWTLIEPIFAVHPGSCGVWVTWKGWQSSRPGSPPVVRGLLNLLPVFLVCERFTPGRAGSVTGPMEDPMPKKVHPRSCGVCLRDGEQIRSCQGSPPVVRGLHYCALEYAHGPRFTPGRAGSARGTTEEGTRLTVHPRSCGVCPIGAHLQRLSSGSPPVVRGLPFSYDTLYSSCLISKSGFAWPGAAPVYVGLFK